MPYEVHIAEVEPQLVAATKVHTNLTRIGEDIGSGFGTLMHAMASNGIAASGPPLIVYHQVIEQESNGDIEICIPVGTEISDDAKVYGRALEGGTMATTMHHGPYPEIGSAYDTLAAWISEHGRQITGPPREIYLNDPQTVAPVDLLTRVEFPISAETS